MEHNIVFRHTEYGIIRMLVIDNEPWFVGTDVIKCLDYDIPNDELIIIIADEDIRRLSKYELQTYLSKSNEHWKDVLDDEYYFINISGLYSIIFLNDIPKDKKFKMWITSDVISSSYKLCNKIILESDMDMIDLCDHIIDEVQEIKLKILSNNQNQPLY